MVKHVFSPSTRESEVGRSLRVQDQFGLQSKFQDSESCYTEKFCFKKPHTYTITLIMSFSLKDTINIPLKGHSISFFQGHTETWLVISSALPIIRFLLLG